MKARAGTTRPQRKNREPDATGRDELPPQLHAATPYTSLSPTLTNVIPGACGL